MGNLTLGESLFLEHSVLSDRIGGLRAYIVTEDFKSLSLEMQDLMSDQLAYMNEYSSCLLARIKLLETNG